MGLCSSKIEPKSSRRHAWVEKRIADLMISMEGDKCEVTHAFNKILLKFPLIKRVFQRVKTVFHAFDTDGSGTIEYKELQNAMNLLGAECTDAEVIAIFDEADLWDNGKLTYREFLVCLALGHLLGYIPLGQEKRYSSRSRTHPEDQAAPTDDQVRTIRVGEAPSRPPSPTADQVRALILDTTEVPLAVDSESAPPTVSRPRSPASGVLTSGKLEDSNSRPASSSQGKRPPRASFTTAEALAREGDTTAAAALAAASAADLAYSEAQATHHRTASDETPKMTDTRRTPSNKQAKETPKVPALATAAVSNAIKHDDMLGLLSSRRGSVNEVNDAALVAWAFRLCLEAFLQLSSHGIIRKEDLRAGIRQLAMMSPPKGAGERGAGGKVSVGSKPLPTSALEFLTDDRFAELDWDSDGQITFREFIYAFVAWTGIEDDEDGVATNSQDAFKSSASRTYSNSKA